MDVILGRSAGDEAAAGPWTIGMARKAMECG
jgi:hypothetical protein